MILWSLFILMLIHSSVSHFEDMFSSRVMGRSPIYIVMPLLNGSRAILQPFNVNASSYILSQQFLGPTFA